MTELWLLGVTIAFVRGGMMDNRGKKGMGILLPVGWETREGGKLETLSKHQQGGI